MQNWESLPKNEQSWDFVPNRGWVDGWPFAIKKNKQSLDFVPNRGWVGKWPFAIQKKFYNIYHLTKLVLDLPNTITASEKKNTHKLHVC